MIGCDRRPPLRRRWRSAGFEAVTGAAFLFRYRTFRWSGRRLSLIRRDRRGTVAVITAMLASALIGFGALAVDVGLWKTNQAALQGGADQAAYAASYNATYGVSTQKNEGKALAAANGFVDGQGGVAVAINIPPLTGSYTTTSNAIEAIITQPQTSFLRGVVSNGPVTASGRAVVAPVTGPTCVMALTPSGYGISLVGAGSIGATNCDVFDDSVSSSANCDVGVIGVAAITAYDVLFGQPACPGLAVVASDNFKAPAAPSPDPYAAYTMPAATQPCMDTGINLLNSAVTLSKPGTYCGFTTIGAVTLNLGAPGVYIFSSSINVTGTFSLSGGSNNTTVVMSGTSTLTVTGAMSVNLHCLTTGPTAGIALWFDKSTGEPFTMTAASYLSIIGALYAPSSAVTLVGAEDTICTQLIVSSLNVTGALALQHNCAGLGVQDAVIGYKLEE